MTKKRMIIVGASPRLLEREYGAQIDEFPSVCRFNDFHTKGFEKHVGSRTTHWVTGVSKNAQVKRRSLRGLKVLCAYPSKVFARRSSRFARALLVWKRLRINPLFCGEISLREIEKIQAISGIDYCSTGLIGITYFTFLRGYDVTITGFDFFTSARQHYYNEKKLEVVDAHDFAAERAVVERWVTEGKLRVLGPLPGQQ